MLPRNTIATAAIPGGETLTLVSHGRDFIIMIGRGELMSSRMQFSEEQLAELTMERVGNPAPRILIGGYGMGYTLRAAMARMGPDGRAVVADLVPEIIEWARDPMAAMTGQSLSDPRVEIEIADVADMITDASEGFTAPYDAILLDVDNGPDGLVRKENDRIYSRPGLARAREALRPGGVLAIWSAAPDPSFVRRLKGAGFDVEELTVRARPNNKGARHTIWFARPRSPSP